MIHDVMVKIKENIPGKYPRLDVIHFMRNACGSFDSERVDSCDFYVIL